jgi:phage terminase small subunit
MSFDPSQLLACAKKEKFAQLVANGVNYSEAYAQCGYKPHGPNAQRLSKNEKVLRRIEWIRSSCAQKAQITKDELIDFLAKAVKTAVGDIDENNPLAQEVTRDYMGNEIEKQIIRKRIKSVGKMDAAKLLTTLLGWNEPEKVEQKIEIVITKSW